MDIGHSVELNGSSHLSPISEEEAFGRSCGKISWRSFGINPSDLELNLSSGSRPSVITGILLNNVLGIDDSARTNGIMADSADIEGYFWDLTVGDRIHNLISLTYQDGSQIVLTLVCPNSDCGEAMEVPVERDALLGIQRERDVDENITVSIRGETIILRKPTGRDQQQWLGASFSSPDEAARAMIASLIIENKAFEEVDGTEGIVGTEHLGPMGTQGNQAISEEMDLSPEWIGDIDEAMEEADPLVNFTVAVTCPTCKHESSHAVDLEGLALSRLREKQHILLRTVHMLASHYHWTEEEILSLPPWRRTYYLSLIGNQ